MSSTIRRALRREGHSDHESPGTGETGRVEAFSDGVFSVAITLLVLDLHVPLPQTALSGPGLADLLWQQWPSLVAFVLSFTFVLIGWINHTRLFTHIRRVDGAFLFLNGFMLLMFTVVPFTTSLLATYMRQPDARIAAEVYAGANLLLATSFQLLWLHASKGNRLLRADVKPDRVRRIQREYWASYPFFVAAFAASFVNLAVSIVLITVMMAFYAVTGFTATHSA